ncbi:hypothetical protein EBV26_00400 [bacterium]|nr:hypothetical protein [bacterium]
MKLYLYIFCIVLGNGFLIQNNVCGFSKSFIYDKNESKLGVEMQRGLIIDKQMISMTNPNRVNSTTDNEVNLKPAVFGIDFDYEIPLINKESKPIKIDSIRFINSIGEFIYVGINSDLILPDDYLVVKFKFLHNQPGDFICSFKVYTDLDNASGSMPDSIANPIFSLRGTVRKTQVDIIDEGCNFYYINSKKYPVLDSLKRDTINICQCHKTITIINNGIDNVAYSLALTKGSEQHFEFKEYIQTTGFVEFKLNQRNTLKPAEKRKVYIFYKPKNNIPGVYDGTITIKPETPSSFSLEPVDISFTTVKPIINIVCDTLINSRPGDTVRIPIRFTINYLPKIQIDSNKEFLASTFEVLMPNESLRSFYNMNFVLARNINTQNNFKITNQLEIDTNTSEPRYYKFENGYYNLYRNQNYIYDLGELSLKYFFSEHKTSEIKLTALNLNFEQFGSCYSSISLDTYRIQIHNSEYQAEDFCIKFDNDFFSNLRDSTNDFTAAMRVSGEPVMEIQHYLKEPIQTEISLYSINGMKLETIFSGMAKADLQQIRHPMSHLPPGVYLCEMIAGQFRKTMPIILNR